MYQNNKKSFEEFYFSKYHFITPIGKKNIIRIAASIYSLPKR